MSMRIGLPGLGSTTDRIIRQAEEAEADRFSSLWYASAVGGDPVTAMALAGRATTSIELGTAILQTYACHPLLQATRAVAAAAAIGQPGRFTLGVGPSHEVVIHGMLGLSYEHPVDDHFVRGADAEREAAGLAYRCGRRDRSGGLQQRVARVGLQDRRSELDARGRTAGQRHGGHRITADGRGIPKAR